jgi:hypothetical protein
MLWNLTVCAHANYYLLEATISQLKQDVAAYAASMLLCCVLCAVCCVLCVVCCVLCTVCCVLRVVCCVLCAACCMLRTMCYVLCTCCIYAVSTLYLRCCHSDSLFQEHDVSPVVQPVISCRTRIAIPTIRFLQSGKCGRMHKDVISSRIFAGPGINVGKSPF